jgi:hypothetical protein
VEPVPKGLGEAKPAPKGSGGTEPAPKGSGMAEPLLEGSGEAEPAPEGQCDPKISLVGPDQAATMLIIVLDGRRSMFSNSCHTDTLILVLDRYLLSSNAR